jgi:uncharacterized protein (DUF305 family)
MQKNSLVVGLVFLVIGLVLGFTFQNGRMGTVFGGSVATNTRASGSMMGQNTDQSFIENMIPHHEGAIAMAKLALTRSKRIEIITLSNNIIAAQEKEITDMKTWYEQWFGTLPATKSTNGMGMMHMDSMSGDTAKLQAVGDANFDREFIVEMIPHHELAIMMANMLQASTDRAEMKQLAINIITSQSAEIAQMRGWLATWYK